MNWSYVAGQAFGTIVVFFAFWLWVRFGGFERWLDKEMKKARDTTFTER